jgi:hypothetical protein
LRKFSTTNPLKHHFLIVFLHNFPFISLDSVTLFYLIVICPFPRRKLHR